MDIEYWRKEIDEVDAQLLRLLNMRARLALKVGALKKAKQLPFCDPDRERYVLARLQDNNTGPLDDRAVYKLFRRIIRESRRIQLDAAPARRGTREEGFVSSLAHKRRVAFQGERGAFSEEAALKLLGHDIELVPQRTFAALFASIENGAADYVLAPLANSIAGPVQASVDLLRRSALVALDEVEIQIDQHLIGYPSAVFEGLQIVQSHPVALAQCQRFLAAHPRLKTVVADDTAGSVAEVMQRRDATRAAIAGRRAAEIYGASIIRESIQDRPENFTRFVLLTLKGNES